LTTADDEEVAMPQQGHRVILLVGFMGAGKTSVGKMLAERLNRRFVDVDDLVVAREGRSIAQIFEEAGEPGFRSRESAALQELLSGSPSIGDTVVAVGGGALSQAENRTTIERSLPYKIFLDAPVEELFERCVSQDLSRPLLKDLSSFRKLYLSRRPHYSADATRVDTSGKSVAQVSEEVRLLLEGDTFSLKERS
jgi:shikimate kinase